MNEKIIAIEKKLAFHEHTLEQLSQVIVDQEKLIKSLEAKLAFLHNQLTDEQLVKPLDDEQPPPHY